MQHLRVENDQTPLHARLRPGQVVKVAIAHGEGNYAADAATHRSARGATGASRSAIATRRGRRRRGQSQRSTNAIAGVYNARFNVLGLMPHPENLIDPLVGGVDGRGHVRGPARPETAARSALISPSDARKIDPS